eukprot:6276843-Pyramimonas_sp.AAC.1
MAADLATDADGRVAVRALHDGLDVPPHGLDLIPHGLDVRPHGRRQHARKVDVQHPRAPAEAPRRNDASSVRRRAGLDSRTFQATSG